MEIILKLSDFLYIYYISDYKSLTIIDLIQKATPSAIARSYSIYSSHDSHICSSIIYYPGNLNESNIYDSHAGFYSSYSGSYSFY